MTTLQQAMQVRADEFISLRRNIHRHPEGAFGAQRTAARVAAQVESVEVQAQIGWRPGQAMLGSPPAETALAREVATEGVGAGRVTPQGLPLTEPCRAKQELPTAS